MRFYWLHNPLHGTNSFPVLIYVLPFFLVFRLSFDDGSTGWTAQYFNRRLRCSLLLLLFFLCFFSWTPVRNDWKLSFTLLSYTNSQSNERSHSDAEPVCKIVLKDFSPKIRNFQANQLVFEPLVFGIRYLKMQYLFTTKQVRENFIAASYFIKIHQKIAKVFMACFLIILVIY